MGRHLNNTPEDKEQMIKEIDQLKMIHQKLKDGDNSVDDDIQEYSQGFDADDFDFDVIERLHDERAVSSLLFRLEKILMFM